VNKIVANKNEINEKIRLDKWLWAARFFKTRSLAAKAVSGGHIRLNGNRVKSARVVQSGDMLYVRRGEISFTVLVLKTISRRGSATIARTLYEETEESITDREKSREERRLICMPSARPDKRDRRKIREFLRKS
jgi:ribosome-associated heat shock protein Hsp15